MAAKSLIISVLVFLSLILSNSVYLFASDTDKESDWVLVNEEKGIKVFERWIAVDKKTKVRERSGKMILHCTPEQVMNIITDANKTNVWMSYVESCEVLKKSSQNEWFVYTLLDAPWPFGRQDMVSRYVVTSDCQTNTTKLTIYRQLNMIPEKKGIERLDTFNAEWIIEKVDNSTINVTFTTKSTQPPKYPAWAQDPVVRKVFLQNLEKLKDYLGQS
jgi:hypothetical protein